MDYSKIFQIFESIYGNLAIVYHRTDSKDAIYSFDEGNKFIPGNGDFYGKGMYSTFDLQTALSYDNGTARYGKYIVKFRVTNVDSYLVFDWLLFSKSEKFKELKRKYPDISNVNFVKYQLLSYGIWSKVDLDSLPILNRTKSMEEIYKTGIKIETQASIAKTLVETLSIDKCVPGIVYTGGSHDPNVLVTYERDLKYLIPLSYSTDGSTWTKFSTSSIERGSLSDVENSISDLKSKYFISKIYNYFSDFDSSLYDIKKDDDTSMRILSYTEMYSSYIDELKERLNACPEFSELYSNFIKNIQENKSLSYAIYILISCTGKKVYIDISLGTYDKTIANLYSKDIFLKDVSFAEEKRVEEYILKCLHYISLEDDLKPYLATFLDSLDKVYYNSIDSNKSDTYCRTYDSHMINNENDFEKGDESIDKVNSEFLDMVDIENDISELKAKYQVSFDCSSEEEIVVSLAIDIESTLDFTDPVEIDKDSEIINREIKNYYSNGKKLEQKGVEEILSKCKVINKFLKK
jgi:hypothetical protein